MSAQGVYDKSGVITSGTTAQDVEAANAGRQYLLIQNLDAAEDLWVNFAANAAIATAGSIQVKPGLMLVFEDSACPKGRVSVNATTTNHKFTCKVG